MRNITYKFKVGDIVKFKDNFGPTASCDLKGLEGTVGVVADKRDYNGPSYLIAGTNCYYKESCFAGLA